MSNRIKHILTRAALATVALVCLTLGGAGLYAYGQVVGSDAVAAAEIRDAGQVQADDGLAFDPARPNEAAPTAVEVPSVESPGALFEFTKDARELGGLWLAIAIVLGAIAAYGRKHTAPKPGEEEADPKSWRARSHAIFAAVAAVTATLIDIGFGGVGWTALALPIAWSIGRVMDAVNPPKGSAKAKDAQAAKE